MEIDIVMNNILASIPHTMNIMTVLIIYTIYIYMYHPYYKVLEQLYSVWLLRHYYCKYYNTDAARCCGITCIKLMIFIPGGVNTCVDNCYSIHGELLLCI